jgi:hypothetical protein
MSLDVAGYCPACGWRSLFLAYGGHVTCRRAACPSPTSADTILDDPETEHVVELGPHGFTVRHPLRERLGDELMHCHLHWDLAALDEPPAPLGRYRVLSGPAGWTWESLQ